MSKNFNEMTIAIVLLRWPNITSCLLHLKSCNLLFGRLKRCGNRKLEKMLDDLWICSLKREVLKDVIKNFCCFQSLWWLVGIMLFVLLAQSFSLFDVPQAVAAANLIGSGISLGNVKHDLSRPC